MAQDDDTISGLQFEIARLEESAQDAEDGERLQRASTLRAQARARKAELQAVLDQRSAS